MSAEVTPSARDEAYRTLIEAAPYDSGTLYGYHSMAARWHTTTNAEYRFGFEAEKEDGQGTNIASVYQGDNEDLLAHQYRAERDGSLGMGGFELVSPVYDLTNDHYLDHLSDPVLNFLIHCNTGFRCGGHITISRKDADHAYYNTKTAQVIPLLYALYPKRAKLRGYARFFSNGDYNDRYNAVNIKHDSMEIRIFAGIKSLKQLRWRVELLRILFTTDKYEADMSWSTLYEDLLDMTTPIGAHLHRMYQKKYGEKIMLAAAYAKAYEKQEMEWQDYTRVSKLMPGGVRRRLKVKPSAVIPTNNPQQLTLNVCDYHQEQPGEA